MENACLRFPFSKPKVCPSKSVLLDRPIPKVAQAFKAIFFESQISAGLVVRIDMCKIVLLQIYVWMDTCMYTLCH